MLGVLIGCKISDGRKHEVHVKIQRTWQQIESSPGEITTF